MNITEIINKYDKIGKEYHDSMMKSNFPDYKDDLKKYSPILRKVSSFYSFMNYISSLKITTNNQYNTVLLGIMSKSSLDLYGIYTCLLNGLESQAAVIFRVLFEMSINIDLMFQKDVDERIKLFYNFGNIQRYTHYQKQMELDSNYSTSMKMKPEYIEFLKQHYEQYINDYNTKRPYSW